MRHGNQNKRVRLNGLTISAADEQEQPVNIGDLISRYENYRVRFGNEACKKISQLLAEAKEQHRIDFLNGNTADRARSEGRQPDHEQSWRAFKGKNLEKLIVHIIKKEVESLGLKIVEGNKLERTKTANLNNELNQVKRNLLVDYGMFGAYLPDVDIVIYHPATKRVVAVLSSKVTLRERIAQTGYWKLKLSADNLTKHIRVYFITPDEDGTLISKEPMKKGRAIVEADLDGSYLLCEDTVEESDKVKTFDKFIADLRDLIKP
jgi:type II restriction enzyme